MRSMLNLLVLLTLAPPAFSSDGVLEINQTCAVETGCFSGDTAGLPVTISASGSYRLTSNLIVPDENTDGIQVSTDNVSIDLAGFEIRGPVVCSGSPLTCTPNAGSGSGVERIISGNRGISVKNGSITGMGNYGVLLGDQADVTNLRVRWNRFFGIYVNPGSTVSGNTIYQNGFTGIIAGEGSTVSGNTVYQNGGNGISAGNGATVSGNTAYGNVGVGLGLDQGAQSAYRDNTFAGNGFGSLSGSGVNAGGNVCNGSLTCP